MKRLLVVAVLCIGSLALAQAAKDAKAPAADPKAPEAKGAPMMDMTKMGPWSRKPSDEKKIKKEIEDFFKKEQELTAKGDQEALTARVDFPVYMVSDDLKGVAEAKPYSRDEYVATMKPFYENMPKDVKYTHKANITVLSESLASVTDDFTMTMGKEKLAGRNAGLLVKVGSEWKWKVMAEAGWGGMGPPAQPEAKPAAAPAPKK